MDSTDSESTREVDLHGTAKSVDAVLPAGTMIAGRYRIVRLAGKGGMGIVYVVEHVNTGGRAALKLMRGAYANERAVERFRREARASATIQSDHVVRVSDADVAPELGNAPFIVMELLDGEDLAEYLTRKDKLDPQETVDLLVQVARGLDRAHAAGVTHRDLKPQNIFLHRRDDGATVVKLVDFGLSKVRGQVDTSEVSGLTRPEELVGTPTWMSPEQALSMHHVVGPPTDIFSVGLLAFCMLTGDSYWGDACDTIQILGALASVERPAPSTRNARLSPEFDRWFATSCERDPEKRWPSAGVQVAELARALGVKMPRNHSSPDLAAPRTLEVPDDPTPPMFDVDDDAATLRPSLEQPSLGGTVTLITTTAPPPAAVMSSPPLHAVRVVAEKPAAARKDSSFARFVAIGAAVGVFTAVIVWLAAPDKPRTPAVAREVAPPPVASDPVPSEPLVVVAPPAVPPPLASDAPPPPRVPAPRPKPKRRDAFDSQK